MNIKKIFSSKMPASVSLLFLLSGCQSATNSSLETLITPKRKVPPYEEVVKQAENEPEEEVIIPFESDAAATTKNEELKTQPRLNPLGQSFIARQEMSLPSLPDNRYLSERITFYKKKRERWQALASSFSSLDLVMPEATMWTECLALISETQNGYMILQERIRESYTPENDLPLFEAFQQDISFLESDCERVFASAASAVPEELEKYREIIAGQADSVVTHWAMLDDNDKIISSFENLLIATGGSVSVDAREIYGKALKADGRFDQAAAILLQVADERGDFAGMELRLEAAEILFAQGNFKRAQEEYEKLASLIGNMQRIDFQVTQYLTLLQGQAEHGRELDLFGQALGGWLRFAGTTIPPALAKNVLALENSFPESEYTRLARQLFDKAGGTVQTYVDQELQHVRELAAQKKFIPAEEILNTLLQGTESESLLLRIKEAQNEVKVLHEEEKTREEKRRVQELENKWQEASGVFDQRQYDAAIRLFQELINSEYRDQARAKMTEATNLAASELRKESAGLFVQSRKVEHPEQKAALLLESRRLLLLIQEKYPDAEVISKVKQNIAAIEEQIRILDPSLLEK